MDKKSGIAVEFDELISFLAKNGIEGINGFAKSKQISEEEAQNILKEAESEYGITPAIKIDTKKLGYVSFLMEGKFYGGAPGLSELKQELEKDPHIQLALLQDDNSTILLYYLIEKENHEDYYGWNFTKAFYELQRNLFFHYYISWLFSRVALVEGSIPISSSFFTLLRSITWRRSKATPRPLPGQFTYKKLILLKELFDNPLQAPSDID
ncbi:MAG: hypothetical protein QW045_02065, partial [Candidatus Micrarchaeaceae archaeon]